MTYRRSLFGVSGVRILSGFVAPPIEHPQLTHFGAEDAPREVLQISASPLFAIFV